MNRRKSVTILVLGFFYALCRSLSADQIVYEHSIELETMSFKWKLANNQIHIALAAVTTSWVGIGFNPSDKMKDANFIIGYVKNGQAEVIDHFGIAAQQHKSDENSGGKSDVTNISGNQTGGITQVNFTIPLNSGDSKDTVIIPDAEILVLLAYGAGRDSFESKHVFQAKLKVNLTTGKYLVAD